MASIKDIASVWKNIKEIDLKPIRESAMQAVKIAVVGEEGSGRHALAEQMRCDPARADVHTQTSIAFPPVDVSAGAVDADLIIVLVDAARKDFPGEQALVKKWTEAGKNVLVFANTHGLPEGDGIASSQLGWQAMRIFHGPVDDAAFLQHELVPLVMEMLPLQHLALGRQFPLFRLLIARQIINDTCFSNAAYSFSTGLAEIVPVLDIPLNVTDMIVLTKSQAFLAYKLGLLLGFSTNWQDYVTEFGSVIGSGFLLRQIARQLIGLIPAWGIIPKVGVSYSGTYVVGHAILGWYLTGKHLTPKQLRALSVQAFTRGREVARKLSGRFPKPRLGKRKQSSLPAPPEIPVLEAGNPEGQATYALQEDATDTGGLEPQTPGAAERLASERAAQPGRQPKRRKRITLVKRRIPAVHAEWRTCLICGKSSSADAGFCQYCGSKFDR